MNKILKYLMKIDEYYQLFIDLMKQIYNDNFMLKSLYNVYKYNIYYYLI